MLRTLPALLLLLIVVPAMAAEEVVIHRVFGPEIPGRYKHPASFTELDNGDLYLVYYGGEGEYEGDTAVFGARLPAGSREWTKPTIIADTPGRSEGNAVVWQCRMDWCGCFMSRGTGRPGLRLGSSTRSPRMEPARGPIRSCWHSIWA